MAVAPASGIASPAIHSPADAEGAGVVARSDRLLAERANFTSMWQEIRDHFNPAGDAFTTKETNGVKTHQTLFDGTGEECSDLLAAGLIGMLTNGQTDWCAVQAEDDRLNDREDVAAWLQRSSRRMLGVFNGPAFGWAPQQHAKVKDLVDYGSGGMLLLDRPGFGPTFVTAPIGQLCFTVDANGKVDGVFRRYPITAAQIVEKFSRAGDTLPDKIRKAAATPRSADDPFELIHAVQPRRGRDPRRADRANMAWAEHYVLRDGGFVLRRGGYREFPWNTPRWPTRAGEAYGRGPGTKALADIKMLQRSMKSVIRGIETTASPSLMVSDDGVLSPVRLTPSGVTVVRADAMMQAGDPIRPIKTGARPDVGEDFNEGVRRRVENAYFKPLLLKFQTGGKTPMTATQAIEISEEVLMLLGPVIGRLISEDLGPQIDRVWSMMVRNRWFEPPPAALDGAELKVVYRSPFAQAQQLGELRAVGRAVELLAPVVQANPGVLDNFDFDDTARRIWRASGAWMTGLRDPKKVREIRDARNQAAEAEAQRQAAMEAATVAGKAVPALAALGGGAGAGGASGGRRAA